MAGPTGKEPPGEKDKETGTSHDGTPVLRTSIPPPRKAGTSRKPAPQRLGRYEIERLLGQGGMGRVWLARDTVLGRKVAIKVLRDDLALPPAVYHELVLRMGHEARAAAAVSHPNIVVLHDMGEDDLHGLFLVFEYVTTKTDDISAGSSDDEVVLSLRDRLRRGPLTFAEVAKLAREVGSALSFAHEAGVIHRDVKPENILFSRNGFKIADFGIARIPESTITRTNTVLGTPAYTAPEALSKGEFSSASDQFSLAATLYEAATGGRAFAAEDAITTAGKVSSEPPPPLHEAIGDGAVVRALDQAIQRGLAKAPEDRFASCAELGQAVVRALEQAVDGPRRAVSGWPAALLTPSPKLDLERTPLSSRARAAPPNILAAIHAASKETPRPSLILRRKTQRIQNIAAGIAILVLVVLVLLGRRTPNEGGAAASASVSASRPSASTALAPHATKPRRPTPQTTTTTTTTTTTESLDASPPPDTND